MTSYCTALLCTPSRQVTPHHTTPHHTTPHHTQPHESHFVALSSVVVQAAQGEAEGHIQQLTAQLEEAQAAPPTGTPFLLMCFPSTVLILWQPLHCVFALLCSKDCFKRLLGRPYILYNHMHFAAWVTVLIRHLGYQADVSKLHVQSSPSSSL